MGQLHGITTDGDGLVSEISLGSNGLSGKACGFTSSSLIQAVDPFVTAVTLYSNYILAVIDLVMLCIDLIRRHTGFVGRAHEFDVALSVWKPAVRY